jgi:hypothetical protein
MYGHERIIRKEQEIREAQMTGLLIRLFFVFAVLPVISLFVCTLPVWLIVLAFFGLALFERVLLLAG